MFGTNGNGGAASRGAGYPASPLPHGMLMSEDRGFSKKATAKWAMVEERLSMACAAVGLLVFLFSLKFLFGFTEVTGQILGLVLMGSGCVGYLGGRRRSANIVNAQLVACLLGVLLSFNMITEVVRDTQVDCALAELFHRGQATKKQLAAVQQQEAMSAVFERLNQMEDHLTLVQQGAAKQAELRSDQLNLKMNDLHYIRSKVDLVKKHAQDVLDSVLKNPDVTVERINMLTEEQKNDLRRRMDVADKVLERIERHHTSADEQLTFQEYQEILQALTQANGAPSKDLLPPELQQALGDMPNIKVALERSKTDVYHTLALGDAPRHLEQINAYRQQQRERFNEEFSKHLAKAEESGDDFLMDLPEHCVKETAGEKVMVASGLLSIALQLAQAYTALSLSFRLPIKSA